MEAKNQRPRAGARGLVIGGAGAVALTLFCGTSAHGAPIPGTSLEPYAWFKADAISGIADGGSLATWADSSANGRNATQTSNNLRQPSFRANGLGTGLPSVRFNTNGDAVNEFMAFANPVANEATSAMTVFVVAIDSGTRTGGTAARGTIVSTRQGATTATNNGFVFGFGANPNVATYAHVSKAMVGGGSVQSSPMTGGGISLLSVTRDGSTSTLETFTDDGSNASTVTWDGFVPSGQATTQIGTEAGANYFFGDVGEIVIFGSALSDADYQSVASYLGEKYAVPVPEPTTGMAMTAAGGLLLARRRRVRA